MSELRRCGAGPTRPSGGVCTGTVWRWTIIFWLAALVMPTAVRFGHAEEPPASQAEVLTEAQTIREEMFEVVTRLVRQFPSDGKAVCLLGTVHNNQGNTTEAVALWKGYLKVNPRWADTYNCLAMVALRRGDNDEAIALWRKAIQIDPHMEDAYDWLGGTLMHPGKIREAIDLLQKYVMVNEKAVWSHYWLGQAYMQSREYEKAKKHYLATVVLRPSFYSTYYGLATIASRQGDTQAAAEYRKPFARWKAENRGIQDDKRQAYGDTQTLRQELALVCTDVGQVYRNHGYLWQAEKHWKKAAKLDPANAGCREELAVFYQKQERYQQKALEILSELIELHPERAVYYLNMGAIHARLEHFDDAEKAFRKVCELSPEKSAGYVSLVQLYLRDGRKLADVATLAEKAVQLEPTAANYFLLCSVYQKNNEPAKARSAIQRALELDPDNPTYGKMQKLVQENP